MGQFTHDGMIYEELPGGKARVVGPAAGGSPAPQPFQLSGPDPSKTAKDAREAIEFSERNQPSLPKGWRWKNGQTGGEAELIPGLPPPANAPPADADAAKANIRAEAISKIRLARDLAKRSQEGYFTTGFGSGIAGSIRGTNAYDLAQDTETIKNAGGLQRIMEMSKANGGKNPLTPLSNTDFQALVNSLTNLDPGQSDEQYQENLKVVEDLYSRLYEQAGGTGLADALAVPDAADGTIATGATADQKPPPEMVAELRGYAAARSGQDVDRQDFAAFYNGLAKRHNFPGGTPESIEAYRQSIRQGNFGGIDPAKRPTSAIERGRNSFVASAPGTALANAANMGGFGIPQALAGNEAFDAINAQNPNAAMLGQVAGAITGSGAIGRLGGMTAGKLAPTLLGGGSKAQFGRNLAADAAYGGAFGGVTEGDPLTGAATAALGSGLGQGAGSVIGRGLTGATAPIAKRLNDAGVTLSLGQIMKDRGGLSGKIIGGIEDRAAGFPVVGDMIQGLRTRGLDDANILSTNQALKPIGARVTESGNAGYAQADQAVSNAYDAALGPMRLQADDPFIDSLKANRDYAEGIIRPNIGPNGEMTGEQLQTIKRLIDAESANNARVPGGFTNINRLGDIRSSLFDMADRQAPDLASAYRNADEAYSGLVPIRTATANAGNNRGVFTPAQLGIAMRSTDRSVGKGQTALGNRPGQALQQDMQSILPSSVPDSGTAGRLLVGGLAGAGGIAGGTGMVDPATAAAITLPALLYTKTGQKLVAKALLGERPVVVGALGKKIRKRKGLFGSAAAAPLLEQ